MNFDITRAWKDENYRENLSEEELNTLPANPAGELELNETELDAVAGGFGPGFGSGFGFGSCGSCGSCGCGGVAVFNHQNSVAVICEININSINIGNIAILGAVTNTCINSN